MLCDLPGSNRDPDALTTHRLTADARSAALALREAVSGERDGAWLDEWRTRDARARDALSEYTLAAPDPFEGRAVVELQRALPAGATIFAGNSMPVRDVDSFLASDEKPLAVASNRGANGIDGVVSSALGHAAAGLGPVALLIGDLSLYHDLNGLWAGARHGLDLTVVLVNNAGSAIFHYLPQAAHEHVFEEWFATPSDIDFAAAARAYGASHCLLERLERVAGSACPVRAGRPHRGDPHRPRAQPRNARGGVGEGLRGGLVMTLVPLEGGFALNVERAGSGPPLVLLHGFTGSATSWGPLAEMLAARNTVLALDIVGHGASGKPDDLAPYAIDRAARDAVAAMLAFGFRRASWLGYSMGGRLALYVAATIPKAVDRLVLIGASPGLADPGEREARRAADEALADRIETKAFPPSSTTGSPCPFSKPNSACPRA